MDINNRNTKNAKGKIRLAIIGTRGIPVKYGGFETFAEEISTLFEKNGFDVFVQCDKDSYHCNEYKGINLFFSTVTKTSNPIRYYYDGLTWALKNSDIIFAHTTGGSVFYFLKFFKKKIIVTNTDGLEYKRAKWPLPQRLYLKFSEFLAVLLSDYLIADSPRIGEYLISRFPWIKIKEKLRIIEYGAYLIDSYSQDVLNEFNLSPKQYYLVVSRLEPENNIRMIIEGFKLSATSSQLIIVGNLMKNKYNNEIKALADDKRIRFVGGIYDKNKLSSLRFACKAYIHGHSVGGTNPSLLEAMGCGNLIICHDNVFNRCVTDDRQFYFKTADELCDNITKIEKLTIEEAGVYCKNGIRQIKEYYNWDKIYRKYNDLLNEIDPEINHRMSVKADQLSTLSIAKDTNGKNKLLKEAELKKDTGNDQPVL